MTDGKIETAGVDPPPVTTIRACVTPDEHAAIRRVARHKMGSTIDDLVRTAVDKHLRDMTGRTLAELAESERSKGKMVQMELF